MAEISPRTIGPEGHAAQSGKKVISKCEPSAPALADAVPSRPGSAASSQRPSPPLSASEASMAVVADDSMQQCQPVDAPPSSAGRSDQPEQQQPGLSDVPADLNFLIAGQCGLYGGCTLPRWHKGLCQLDMGGRRAGRAPRRFEAEPAPNPRDVMKRAREEGKMPPLKKRPDPPEPLEPGAQPSKRGRKRKAGSADENADSSGTAAAEAQVGDAAEAKASLGARRSTRSQGAPVWDVEVHACTHTGEAADEGKGAGGGAAAIGGAAVRALLSVGTDGHIALRLGVPPRASRKPTKGALAMLRDFLGKGHGDRTANASFVSREDERKEELTMERGVRWGCLCRGTTLFGGVELRCRRCELTFHSKCERLDYPNAEVGRAQSDACTLLAARLCGLSPGSALASPPARPATRSSPVASPVRTTRTPRPSSLPFPSCPVPPVPRAPLVSPVFPAVLLSRPVHHPSRRIHCSHPTRRSAQKNLPAPPARLSSAQADGRQRHLPLLGLRGTRAPRGPLTRIWREPNQPQMSPR